VRSCGDCTFCCRPMAIEELQKPVGVLCQHCQPGVGCKIYLDRPPSCVSFECAWLTSDQIPEDWRPDKIRAMVVGNDEHVLTMWVTYMDKMTREARILADALVEQGNVVLLAEGQKRKALVPQKMAGSNPFIQIVNKGFNGEEVVVEVPAEIGGQRIVVKRHS
jgi:hypothetical protein